MEQVRRIVTVAFFVSAALQSSQDFKADYSSSNSYNGVEVTVENFLELVPREPDHIKKKVDTWLTENPELTGHLSGIEAFEQSQRYHIPPALNPDGEARKLYFFNARKLFEEKGYPTLSPSVNWVCKITDHAVIKASGAPNRRENINAFLKKQYGTLPTQAQLYDYNQRCGVFYQRLSDHFYALRAQEVVQREGLSGVVKILPLYPHHIPGRPTRLCDTNYLTVQQWVNAPVTYLEESRQALDSGVMRAMTKVIGYTALWNHEKNILVDNQGTVIPVDYEQPNNHSAADFPHKNMQVHRSNVGHGWAEYKNQIIKKAGEKYTVDTADLINEMERLEEQITLTWK